MVTRRDVIAAAAVAPLVVGASMDADWAPVDRIGPDLHGDWESAATGHFISVSSTGIEVFHRLDELLIRDPGLVPPYSLFRTVDGALQFQTYDYRETPFLMQSPLVFERSEWRTTRPILARTDVVPGREVFDLIGRTFDRYYPFFAARGVDWTAVRRGVDPDFATSDALFDAVSGMLAPLGDGHVNLTRGERSFNAGRSALRDLLGRVWRSGGGEETEGAFVSRWSAESRASVIETLDPASRGAGANGGLEWGRIGDAGYLRVNRFSGFLPNPSTRQNQVRELQQALAEAEGVFAGTRRVIVDVAHNGGGNDAAAMVVARHFADRRRRVLTYSIRGATERPIELEPAGAAYARPVFLLTSEITASAAECFVLMMRAFPHVRHVGGVTRGIQSSILPKPLPNDFTATMPFQHVLDAQGILHEVSGIRPECEIDPFPAEDLRGRYARLVRDLSTEQAG